VLKQFGISGLGWAPVVVALTLYALLAIVRNTYAGLGAVSPVTVEAGAGMGMSERQVMRKVQIPLAAPILFSGIRTASQQTIGNATLGAFVAAGTLGAPIFLGFAQQADDLVVLGSVALVALAMLVDGALRGVQQAITPAHKRKERRA
jgi:osmoprotectant transport system permease protein